MITLDSALGLLNEQSSRTSLPHVQLPSQQAVYDLDFNFSALLPRPSSPVAHISRTLRPLYLARAQVSPFAVVLLPLCPDSIIIVPSTLVSKGYMPTNCFHTCSHVRQFHPIVFVRSSRPDVITITHGRLRSRRSALRRPCGMGPARRPDSPCPSKRPAVQPRR